MAVEPHQPVLPGYYSRARVFLAKNVWIEVRPGPAGNELDRVEKIFVDELQFRRSEREKGRSAPDRLTPTEWLRVSLYSVILVWFAHDYGQELDARVPLKKINSTIIRGKLSAEFHLAIAGIFAYHPQIITPTERNRLADPMWHAFRHYIPPELLLGFNAQYPAHEKSNSAVLGEIEPALVAWVKEQRVLAAFGNRDMVERRGRYPNEIQDVVDAALAEHDANILQRRRILRKSQSISDGRSD